MDLGKEHDFRNAQWGMCKSDVLSSETDAPVVKTESQLGYFTQILNKNIYVAYIFKDDQLVSTFYALRDMRDNLKDSLNDFEDFKKILVMKYGEPNAGQGDAWADPSYGDANDLKALSLDRAEYAKALKQGRVLHAAMWKTERTWIKVALSKMMEGFDCGVTVEYQDIRHL